MTIVRVSLIHHWRKHRWTRWRGYKPRHWKRSMVMSIPTGPFSRWPGSKRSKRGGTWDPTNSWPNACWIRGLRPGSSPMSRPEPPETPCLSRNTTQGRRDSITRPCSTWGDVSMREIEAPLVWMTDGKLTYFIINWQCAARLRKTFTGLTPFGARFAVLASKSARHLSFDWKFDYSIGLSGTFLIWLLILTLTSVTLTTNPATKDGSRLTASSWS